MPDDKLEHDRGFEPKDLVVRFHTSNIDKFVQARRIFSQHGIDVTHFRDDKMRDSYQYEEKYELGRGPEFLQPALEEIRLRVGANSLFFIEDTSVRIDALSSSDRDFPGLAVKEWFEQVTFDDLDRDLKAKGNNRRATVYSDVALYVPGLAYPVCDQGETQGRIADSPQRSSKNYQFPWLSANTFNGWFVPDGSTKRLGEMSFEESLKFDFRAKSFARLASRIREYVAIANLPSKSYHLSPRRVAVGQLSLFGSPLIVVIGRTCAGKTTFGKYLHDFHQYDHIEASEIMSTVAQKVGIAQPDSFHTAKRVLDVHGPDVVANQIVDSYGPKLAGRVVISGFRTIEEVMYIRRHYPSCRVVFINAGERIRFDRHLVRGRLEEVATLEEFRQHDRQQVMFGLLGRGKDISDVVLENDGSLSSFFSHIGSVVDGYYHRVQGRSDSRSHFVKIRKSRLFRCLVALSGCDVPVSPVDLMDHINMSPELPNISARHINWVLLCHPELAFRVGSKGKSIAYRLSAAGRAYVKAIGYVENKIS